MFYETLHIHPLQQNNQLLPNLRQRKPGTEKVDTKVNSKKDKTHQIRIDNKGFEMF